MKWRIARTVIILAVVFQLQLIGFLNPTIEKAQASSTADITLYFTPIGGGAPPPSGFTLTYIDDYTVKMEWSLGGTSNNTMVRVKDNGYPTGPTDGYLVYYGDAFSANDTAVDYYNFLGKKYYAAWTDNKTSDDDPNWGWSFSPAMAELECPAVSDLVIQMEAFNNLFNLILGQVEYLFPLVIVIVFLAFALWKQDMILYLAAGTLSIIVGVNFIDDYPGATLVVWFIGLYMLTQAIIMVLKAGGSSRGISQFKGFIDKVRKK